MKTMQSGVIFCTKQYNDQSVFAFNLK